MGEVRWLEGQGAQQNEQSGSQPKHPLLHGGQAPFLPDDLRQEAAEGLNGANGQEQAEQNHAHLAVFQPRYFFVQQQADAAGTHIAQNGTVPHVGFQQVEDV